MTLRSTSRALRRAGALCAAALFAAAQLLAADAALAQTQKPLKKVKIAVGTTLLNVGYPWLTLPIALDYWKAEGYDVQVFATRGGSLQAMQQVVGGNADFAQVNSTAVFIQANARTTPGRVVMKNGMIDGPLLGARGQPGQGRNDLKGKTIGVLSLAPAGSCSRILTSG